MANYSDLIEEHIDHAVNKWSKGFSIENPFKDLISMGELVDRLSIINFKLYKLKDDVMNRPDDSEFGAWAAKEDVRLVLERARLKRCIDEKLISIINNVKSGDNTGGFNAEVKKYGN